MASSYTTNKDFEKPGNGDYVDTWNVPVNGDLNVIDYALGYAISFNATAGSQTLGSYDHTTKVLATYSYVPLIINITGAISANVIYTIPSGVGGQWIIRNTTTDVTGGPWTVTFASGGGGTSQTITRLQNTVIYSDGTNIRLANDSPAAFPPSGTAMLFVQTTAPTGWTKSTTHDNKALRVVSGTASSGGTVAFTTAFASQTTTIGNTTLTASQIPSHTHSFSTQTGTAGTVSGYVTGTAASPVVATGTFTTDGGTGGGTAHTHTSTAINLAVSYVDVIIATKD